MAKVGLRGIKVVEANFKDNNLQATEFTLAPKLTRRISVGDDVHFILRLEAALHSTETQPFPFELECKIEGYFEITEAEGNEASITINTEIELDWQNEKQPLLNNSDNPLVRKKI